MTSRATRGSLLAGLAVVVALAATTVPLPLTAQEKSQPYVVVVNASVQATSVTKSELARIFLKKAQQWKGGQVAVPVDLDERSETRKAFTKEIHRKSVTAVKSYWQQQIFSGREVPPSEKRSDEEVLAAVRSTPGAVGYVSSGVQIGEGLKRLTVTND
jgi:ABC-type phosphate transport system substrate-binding protein